MVCFELSFKCFCELVVWWFLCLYRIVLNGDRINLWLGGVVFLFNWIFLLKLGFEKERLKVGVIVCWVFERVVVCLFELGVENNEMRW